MHTEDNHRGISSLKNIIREKLIYFEGITFMTDLTVKKYVKCSKKNKAVLKREPSRQIVTFYPKQRFVMDVTELPDEFNNKKIYIF